MTLLKRNVSTTIVCYYTFLNMNFIFNHINLIYLLFLHKVLLYTVLNVQSVRVLNLKTVLSSVISYSITRYTPLSFRIRVSSKMIIFSVWYLDKYIEIFHSLMHLCIIYNLRLLIILTCLNLLTNVFVSYTSTIMTITREFAVLLKRMKCKKITARGVGRRCSYATRGSGLRFPRLSRTRVPTSLLPVAWTKKEK